MPDFLTVSEISREAEERYGIKVAPRVISDLIYQRRLDAGSCPLIGGRRLVPRELLPAVVQILRGRGPQSAAKMEGTA